MPVVYSSERPSIETGDYFCTRQLPTRVRCVAYTAPPPNGRRITVISPGTFLGPVGCYRHIEKYSTIEVRGYWINVWRADANGDGRPVWFASKVPKDVVSQLCEHGWYHDARSRGNAVYPSLPAISTSRASSSHLPHPLAETAGGFHTNDPQTVTKDCGICFENLRNGWAVHTLECMCTYHYWFISNYMMCSSSSR